MTDSFFTVYAHFGFWTTKSKSIMLKIMQCYILEWIPRCRRCHHSAVYKCSKCVKWSSFTCLDWPEVQNFIRFFDKNRLTHNNRWHIPDRWRMCETTAVLKLSCRIFVLYISYWGSSFILICPKVFCMIWGGNVDERFNCACGSRLDPCIVPVECRPLPVA